MDDFSRILVINVTRIGDTLAASPVLDQLHRRWPCATITVMGAARRVEVLENLPGVARVESLSKRTAPLRGWLPGKAFDLALVYNYDEQLVRYGLRVADHVVAFEQKSEDLNRRLYRCVDPSDYPTVHLTERFLRLTTALGIPPASGRILYRCRPEEQEAARQRLRVTGFDGRRPLVGLQIASFPTKSYRDWPAQSFHAFCRLVLARWPKAGFLIYGGSDEQVRTAWLAGELGPNACHLAGRLSLRETGAMMSLTDLYVGVDTGPTHLMSAFDIPIIGLYHPRHPAKELAPKDHPLNFSIDHPFSDDLEGRPRPMDDIGVDRVFGQAERALAKRGFT